MPFAFAVRRGQLTRQPEGRTTMKRLTLKPLFIAVMATLAAPTSFSATPPPVPPPVPVIVTNPATNPVKTSIDQYPRTPVAVDLAGDAQSES